MNYISIIIYIEYRLMALSGTTLTVTTLTTAGLLTNNTSGQVSTVTGSSLGSLLGGSPTFAGLTLSGLGSSLLKTTAGVVGSAVSGTDYQYPVSPGTNITITGANTNVINVIGSPVFTGLTISGLATGVLKVTSGLVSLATAYTDYTPALTASGNVTINTGTNVINTVSIPTFAGIYCSSVGTNNTLSGTSAGSSLLTTGSGGNSLYGYQAGVLITSGTYTTCLGYNSGGVLVTGSNGLYIGNGSTASSSSVSNEGVINVSGSTAIGKGANTLFINANAGLYGYIPGYWWGYAQYTVGGLIRWNTYTNKALVLNPANSTQILCPTPGLYEFNLSGSIFCNSTSVINMNMNVNGSVYLSGPCYYSGLIGWRAISLSAFVVVTNTTTYISYTMGAGMETSTGAPTILTAKFCSL